MALSKEVKSNIIKKYARDEKDTGSPEVQIALLTERINNLTEHLKTHQKRTINARKTHGKQKFLFTKPPPWG